MENDPFAEFKVIIQTANKFKNVMDKKKLKRAKAKCPHCEHGFLHGSISPYNGHFHMSCDGKGCGVAFME